MARASWFGGRDSGRITVSLPRPPRHLDSAARTLGAAVLLGVAADLLLHRTRWGLNLPVWLALLAGALLVLARPRHGRTGRRLAVLAFLPVLLAAGLAWRASPTLGTLDTLFAGAALALPLVRAPVGRLSLAPLSAHAGAMGGAMLYALTGAFRLVGESLPPATARPRWSGTALTVLRGLLLAAPLLLVFGALLTAADAVFRDLALRLTWSPLERAASHIALVLGCAWLAGGYLRGVLAPGPAASAPSPAGRRGGRAEAVIALGLLDALFLAFVVVQVRYLFGGAARVEASTTLTYAEYARHGFFELTTAVALVLPLLLLADWWLRGTAPSTRRAFRVLTVLAVALLLVIVVSALQRMRLYQREYGLTELRVYTTAFMIWLAAALVWFAVTVVRGERERFAIGALVAAWLALAALHALNPDAFIARTNLERHAQGHRFDATYLAGLSADAVPAVAQAVPRLTGEDRCTIIRSLRAREADPDGDWRSWSWSRMQAQRALRDVRPVLADPDCGR
jgi:hypothetical protein